MSNVIVFQRANEVWVAQLLFFLGLKTGKHIFMVSNKVKLKQTDQLHTLNRISKFCMQLVGIIRQMCILSI